MLVLVVVVGLTMACSILLSMATTLAPEALQEKEKKPVSEQLSAFKQIQLWNTKSARKVIEYKRNKKGKKMAWLPPHPHRCDSYLGIFSRTLLH